MVFSFLTRVGLRASIPAPAPSAVTRHIFQASAAAATSEGCNKHMADKTRGSITQHFILSTIFSTMVVRPDSNVLVVHPSTEATLTTISAPPSAPHAPEPNPQNKKSELVAAFRDLWHSLFDWTFLMLIITPKPDIRTINDHRRRKSTHSAGFFVKIFRLFAVAQGLIVSGITKGITTMQAPFSAKLEARTAILPQLAPLRPPNLSLDSATSSSSFSAPNSSSDAVPAPTRAVLPNHYIPKPVSEVPRPRSTSPTTAHIIATLNDLEAQMHTHQFYNLERELEEMDNRMAKVLDYPWMVGSIVSKDDALILSAPDSHESPVLMELPQAPPPARRDGKTIQILPRINEVSENSPNLDCTPYDPTNWPIITFQPLWGPRSQVGTV